MLKGEEKRNFVRLNLLADVVYHKHQAEKKEKISLSKNISGGGVCLILYEKVNKGELLDLEVYLASSIKPIITVGRVAWVSEFAIGDPIKGRRFDIGIEFIKIKKEDLNSINNQVFTHLK